MKSVHVIYCDNRRPNMQIRSITGQNSFGNTIYKRETLEHRTRELFGQIPHASAFDTVSNSRDALAAAALRSEDVIFMFYSDFAITDCDKMSVLIEKACYAHENYRVLSGGRIAGVIYADREAYEASQGAEMKEWPAIEADCLYDLSTADNFRRFITGGFESRFFNMLSGDEHTVIKHSENKAKLKAEYELYGLLPDEMKQWFVRPFGYIEDENGASYKMQRYHMTDLAIRYVHGAIDTAEFEDIMKELFFFIINRSAKEVTSEQYEEVSKNLYIDKVDERIEKLKSLPQYPRIDAVIRAATEYEGIDDIVALYKRLYARIRNSKKFRNVLAVSHGDLCFSNILYSHDASLLLLIDPKGANCADDMYMDPYYDIAKLSHSICGHYDFFNSDLYEISLDEDMRLKLDVDADNREYVEIFAKILKQNGIDFRLVRLYEASLFLSMLPLHIDREKKVLAFTLNAIAILKSLEEVCTKI